MLVVKLNNPLMGTETASSQMLHQWAHIPVVKLNNPLMGTETTTAMIVNVDGKSNR